MKLSYFIYMCTNISPCEGPARTLIIPDKGYPVEIKYFIIIIY